MTEHPIRTRCPHCRRQHRRHYGEHTTPEPGQFCVCSHCGQVAIFTDTLTLRAPNDAERVVATYTPSVVALQVEVMAGGSTETIIKRMGWTP